MYDLDIYIQGTLACTYKNGVKIQAAGSESDAHVRVSMIDPKVKHLEIGWRLDVRLITESLEPLRHQKSPRFRGRALAVWNYVHTSRGSTIEKKNPTRQRYQLTPLTNSNLLYIRNLD